MKVSLLPLMGPLHLRYPAYNAVTVRDALAALEPDAVAITSLQPGALDDPGWQDTPEVALPLTLLPWLQRRGLPLTLALEPSPDEHAAADFRRYLEGYPQAQARLQEAQAALGPVQALLEMPLSLRRIQEEVLPLLREALELKERLFEDGPGTDWLRARVNAMAARILALEHTQVAVLASIDHIPFLEDALGDRVEIVAAPEPAASDEARRRSLLDYAWRGEVPEPGSTIAQLRQLETPEARYHEANLLLAHGHAAEALDLLEVTSQGDFSEPYFLPGYLLARLGQLRDLAGEREAARRAYRAVRAISYAPPEALEAAARGLEAPFTGLDASAR